MMLMFGIEKVLKRSENVSQRNWQELVNRIVQSLKNTYEHRIGQTEDKFLFSQLKNFISQLKKFSIKIMNILNVLGNYGQSTARMVSFSGNTFACQIQPKVSSSNPNETNLVHFEQMWFNFAGFGSKWN